MEIKEWIMIISVIVIVTGWFINSYLNRRHEISKKKLENRLKALESFLPVFNSFSSFSDPFKSDKNLTNKIIESRILFQVYGLQDEWNLFRDFMRALDNKNAKEAEDSINKLLDLIRERIRKELELEEIKL